MCVLKSFTPSSRIREIVNIVLVSKIRQLLLIYCQFPIQMFFHLSTYDSNNTYLLTDVDFIGVIK